MKATIHPKYNPKAQVICSCGNTFTVGSTQDSIHIELCNKCHPFFTGQQKFVDSASRIEKFQKRIQVAADAPKRTKKKEEKKEDQRPLTLREMLQQARR